MKKMALLYMQSLRFLFSNNAKQFISKQCQSSESCTGHIIFFLLLSIWGSNSKSLPLQKVHITFQKHQIFEVACGQG